MAGGRPVKFQSLEELNSKIEAYFADTKEEDLTITGLALALETSRETLMNYEERPEFFDAIKKAKDRIHNAYEKDLRRKGRSGDIFALKNFGWTDKQEIDHTTKGEKLEASPVIAELAKQLNEIHRSTGVGSDGVASSPVGTEASN